MPIFPPSSRETPQTPHPGFTTLPLPETPGEKTWVVLLVDPPMIWTREEWSELSLSSYRACYQRPGGGALHHLCPPPDDPDGPPCTECSPYWEAMISRGWYLLGQGWNWERMLLRSPADTGAFTIKRAFRGKPAPHPRTPSEEMAEIARRLGL